MAKTSADNFLGKVPLFEGLTKKELKSVLRECEEEVFSQGQDIVVQGKSGGRFFLILEGRAKVTIGGRARGTLGPGDAFGEISIIDKKPRSATVTAETPIKALAITSWNFLSILQENWPITNKILQQLCARVRENEKSVTH